MLAALGLSVAPAFHFNDPVFDTTLGYGEIDFLTMTRNLRTNFYMTTHRFYNKF